MGKEYEIKCSSFAISKFDDFVRNSSFFESYDSENKIYSLKMSNAENEWPDGCAKIYGSSIYFCDYMTSTFEIALIFKQIVDHAVLLSESIEITEP